jgi:hypothetical protein
MGATGDQRGDTLLGDILDQPSSIFLGFLLEAGEQKEYTTALINTKRLIGNLRFSEKCL